MLNSFSVEFIFDGSSGNIKNENVIVTIGPTIRSNPDKIRGSNYYSKNLFISLIIEEVKI